MDKKINLKSLHQAANGDGGVFYELADIEGTIFGAGEICDLQEMSEGFKDALGAFFYRLNDKPIDEELSANVRFAVTDSLMTIYGDALIRGDEKVMTGIEDFFDKVFNGVYGDTNLYERVSDAGYIVDQLELGESEALEQSTLYEIAKGFRDNSPKESDLEDGYHIPDKTLFTRDEKRIYEPYKIRESDYRRYKDDLELGEKFVM